MLWDVYRYCREGGNMTRYLLLIIALLLSGSVLSSNYPIEFADFFEERHDTVEVVIAGAGRSQLVDSFVSYDTLRFDDSATNAASLSTYLKEQGLTDAAIGKIISQLVAGIDANPGCKGALSLCIPNDIPNSAEFVFDFDQQKLRIFVDGDMLERQSYHDEYHSHVRTSNALINWSNLYVYTNGDGSDNLNWSNNTTLGLPLGFLSIETQYQQPENTLNLYQALYDAEKEDRRAIVGYQGRQSVMFNSTDFLHYGANYAGVGASLGSSHNLLKGQKQAQKRIYFFAAQPAQLEVYQGERLLFNKVVSEGQQSIGYDELPSGVYTITLVLKQGSQEILKEQSLVVNTSQFVLPVNRWDYRVDVGWLKDLADNYDVFLDDEPTHERSYGRAALAYRPTETWLLASSITSNVKDTLLQVGGYWAYDDSLSAQYNVGVFSSGSQSYYGQVIWGPLSTSYRYVNTGEHDSSLTNLLYGNKTTRDWSVGLSGQVWGGIGYINYSNNQYESGETGLVNAPLRQSESDNVSLSWSKKMFGGQFSVNTTYSMYHGQQSSWNTMLSWTKSFGDNFSARTEFSADREGFAYNRTSATYQNSGDYGYVSSTVGIRRGRESDADLSASLNGHRKAFGYSAYAYMNEGGQYSLSGNLSGTQIVTPQGGLVTHEKARAFVNITPELNEPSNDSLSMDYNALKNGRLWYRDRAPVDRSTLVKLDDFTEVAFELDADKNNIDITNSTYSQFVMPGYYYQLNSKITPLASQIFLLNDMFGEPISSARCLGEACKNIEVLSEDGVIRVNYLKGGVFKLVSQKRLCVYDPRLIGQSYIQTYCLPGLDELDNNIAWKDEPDLIAPHERDRALLYIGKYESTTKSTRILEQLQEVGLPPKSIVIGDSIYVYVRYLKQYSAEQRNLLQRLDAYVILDSIHVDRLFGVR
ncbi:TcfC E-set like domain-containing protein [Shewanella colwelliana]|uniref:TcfC E-set like domain-containing protein n=1 Tax=Shewanella colwelliana TaxID=23 RepID=UPI0037350797